MELDGGRKPILSLIRALICSAKAAFLLNRAITLDLRPLHLLVSLERHSHTERVTADDADLERDA